MIEARSHLIRAGRGRVRVLRLYADGARCAPFHYTVEMGRPYCRVCGCTNRYGCAAPRCCWANAAQTLCSRCAERMTHDNDRH